MWNHNNIEIVFNSAYGANVAEIIGDQFIYLHVLRQMLTAFVL